MANLNVRRGETQRDMPTAWDPMGSMRAMDPLRMIRDIMGVDPFAGLVAPMSAMFAPDIEIKESKDAYVLAADLPGVGMDDLEISVVGNRLTVSGKREEEDRQEDDRFFAYERTYGSFSRAFVLPEGADVDHVKAELDSGVLRISVPKKAEMQPKRIEVGAKEAKEKEATGAKEGGPKKAA
jgi:HSP20 family protein